MTQGECNCGTVSFEIDTKMTDIYICHCSICRRSTGGTGIAVSIVRKDKFVWLSGEDSIKTWTKPNHDWQTSFCEICGSSLPGINDAQNFYIPVSLLNSRQENLKVKHHIFVGSKASWEIIGDDAKQHNEFLLE